MDTKRHVVSRNTKDKVVFLGASSFNTENFDCPNCNCSFRIPREKKTEGARVKCICCSSWFVYTHGYFKKWDEDSATADGKIQSLPVFSKWVKKVSDALDNLLGWLVRSGLLTDEQKHVFFDIVAKSITWKQLKEEGKENVHLFNEAEDLIDTHFRSDVVQALFASGCYTLKPFPVGWDTPLNQVVEMFRKFATRDDVEYLLGFVNSKCEDSYINIVANYVNSVEKHEVVGRSLVNDSFDETLTVPINKIDLSRQFGLRTGIAKQSPFDEWYTSVDAKIDRALTSCRAERKSLAIASARRKGVRVEDDSVFYAPNSECAVCGREHPAYVQRINLVAAKKQWALPGPAGITYSAAQRRGVAVVYLCEKCQTVPDKEIPFVRHLLDIGWMLGTRLTRYDIIHSEEMWPEEREVSQERRRKAWNDIKPTTVSDWICVILAGGIVLAILFGIVYSICTTGKH